MLKKIRLEEQEDGNWKGFMKRGEEELEVRAGDPNTALVMLMTHD
jgi:hypothetical protein